ncbi:MAG TPA: hypothetical protein VKB79_11665 [Bryobacteraceae bacterium]|nr:hypothetical protein [Bryobacteraceae bacterium]
MRIGCLVLLPLASGLLPAAETAAPTATEMREALRYAEGQWGVRVTSEIALDLVSLNSCDRARHDNYAITLVTWSETVLKDENGGVVSVSPPTDDSYRYTIRINSQCKWNPTLLGAVMRHELGHILIGAEYHSADPGSAMYWITKEHGQRVTDEDRARVVDRGALAKAEEPTQGSRALPGIPGKRIRKGLQALSRL